MLLQARIAYRNSGYKAQPGTQEGRKLMSAKFAKNPIMKPIEHKKLTRTIHKSSTFQ